MWSSEAEAGKVPSGFEGMSNYTMEHYIRFGGGVTLQDNQFSEIVGCPSMDTTILNIAVNLYEIENMNTESSMRNIIIPANYYLSDGG